jgi:hypothetical protein
MAQHEPDEEGEEDNDALHWGVILARFRRVWTPHHGGTEDTETTTNHAEIAEIAERFDAA